MSGFDNFVYERVVHPALRGTDQPHQVTLFFLMGTVVTGVTAAALFAAWAGTVLAYVLAALLVCNVAVYNYRMSKVATRLARIKRPFTNPIRAKRVQDRVFMLVQLVIFAVVTAAMGSFGPITGMLVVYLMCSTVMHYLIAVDCR